MTHLEKDLNEFYKIATIQDKLNAGIDFEDLASDEQEQYKK